MAAAQSDPGEVQASALHARAMANLSYIRNTMERATAFTAVPGWGGVGIGLTALAAAALAAAQPTPEGWLQVWVAEAVLAGAIGGVALARKAGRVEAPVLSRPARRFLLSFAPPIAVGALLTLVLYRGGMTRALPGTWLLLYGTGVVTGGDVLGPTGSRDGDLLHGLGDGGTPRPGGMGELVHGAGVRGAAPGIRLADRPEARWLRGAPRGGGGAKPCGRLR